MPRSPRSTGERGAHPISQNEVGKVPPAPQQAVDQEALPVLLLVLLERRAGRWCEVAGFGQAKMHIQVPQSCKAADHVVRALDSCRADWGNRDMH